MTPSAKLALDDLAARSPFPFPDGWASALEGAHSKGRRMYHTLAHVSDVARHFDFARARASVSDPATVFVAILFHDAIYDALASDNEARSAALALEWVARSNVDVSPARVEAFVLATAAHGTIEPAGDLDLALFLDSDMAILGASEAEYDAYERGVAYEYAEAYPEAAYRMGRSRFLEKLIAKPRLYTSDLFHETFDVVARENLRRAMASLAP